MRWRCVGCSDTADDDVIGHSGITVKGRFRCYGIAGCCGMTKCGRISCCGRIDCSDTTGSSGDCDCDSVS